MLPHPISLGLVTNLSFFFFFPQIYFFSALTLILLVFINAFLGFFCKPKDEQPRRQVASVPAALVLAEDAGPVLLPSTGQSRCKTLLI